MSAERRAHVGRWWLPALVMAITTVSPLRGQQEDGAPGSLDPGFGDAGLVFTAVASWHGTNSLRSIAQQVDGRIVAMGETTRGFGLVRYLPDGTLDPSFGNGGIVRHGDDIDGASTPSEMAVRPDGRIVVTAEWPLNPPSNFEIGVAIMQYNPDGTLDATFGIAGMVITDLLGGTAGSDPAALALQPDGAIILAGHYATRRNEHGRGFALIRFTADGSLDRSFGVNGRVRTSFREGNFEPATDVAVQDDGRIVAVGYSSTNRPGLGDFLAARYMPDGSLDPAFGIGGKVIADIDNDTGRASGVAIQADGKIIQLGSVRPTAGPGTDIYLVRYHADGSLDTSFHWDGRVVTDMGSDSDRGLAVAIDSIGRIVVGGSTQRGDNSDLALARYTPFGSLDTSFGTGGRVVLDPLSLSAHNSAFDVLVQPDGKIVTGGPTQSDYDDEEVFAYFSLARFNGGVPHILPFFLHARGVPPVTGALPMKVAAPSLRLLTVNAPSVTWVSDPPVSGTFPTGAAFRFVTPCTRWTWLGKTVRLSSTDVLGGDEEPLAAGTTPGGQRCRQLEVIDVPIAAPVTLSNRRLKLTVSSPGGVHLRLGPGTFVSTTAFEVGP